MIKAIRPTAVKILGGFMIFIFVLILIEYIYSKDRVPLGLYLGETYIGGTSYKELTDYFIELNAELQRKEAVLYLPQEDAKFTYSLQDLGVYFDRDKTMGKIKEEGMPFQFKDKYALYRFGGNIPPFFQIDKVLLYMIIEELETFVKVEARDAEVWGEKGELKFRPHQHGTYINKEELTALLLQELSAWPVSDLLLSLPLKQLEAGITVSNILEQGINGKLHTATTDFNPDDENRVHNITLASEQVNNIILKPGDVFSFNELVGEAGSDCGYKEAPVIVNEELVMGVGGGICQVSSTLYNGALMTGMTIIERHNHSLPVTYLPPGLDATVAYDYFDLKFANELDTHVLVNAEVKQNQLYVNFFGDTTAIDKIEVISKNLTTIPPHENLQIEDGRPSWYRELIQEGKPGYTVETIRIFYQDEKEIKRESLGEDYYAPVPYIYAVGNMLHNNNN